MPICRKFCNIDSPKFRNSLTKFKNQTSRHLHQRILFKVHILEFKTPSYEENPHAKIPKSQIEPNKKCWLTNWLHQHLLLYLNRKSIRLLYRLPKTSIRNMKCSFITCYLHFKWYFKLTKTLKGIIKITPISTI